MKNLIFFLVFAFFPISRAMAQVQDDFSNSDLSQNPTWIGDLNRFTVTDGQLQLLDPNPVSSNTAVLLTNANTSLAQTTTWRFFIHLDFSPSSSNFARIYLFTGTDLNSSEGAYYLQIGGISGSNDAIDFYKLNSNGENDLLINGTVGAAGGASVTAAIELTRTTDGFWTLAVDYAGGNDYQIEGTVIDRSFDQLAYFGIFCRYSSTRSDKFFFDDIFIDPILSDQDPPELASVTAVTADSLRLVFSENLAPTSLLSSNFTIDQGIGQPSQVIVDPEQNNILTLVLAEALINLTSYQITLENIIDQAGNLAPVINRNFQFFFTENPQEGDLLISEFMANPNGAAGIPNFEYIELYNASNKALQLEGTGIASGGSPKFLPDFVLLPEQYLILTNANNSDDFEAEGIVLGIPSLPTLSNGGDEITLSLTDGTILQRLLYDQNWYQDADKQDGGFSIERISFAQPENCPGNWQATVNDQGGTPGKSNSVVGISTETNPPNIKSAFVADATTIKMAFDETISDLMAINSIYQLRPALPITAARISGPRLDSVTLELASPIQAGIVYTLTIDQTEDCLGNFQAEPQQIQLAIPQPLEVGDLQLNELLFNPQSGGKDFIEIVNTSEKVISINGLQIINRQKTSGNTQTQIDFEQLLLPGQYLAITPDVADLQQRYPIPAEANLVEADLPTLDARSGNVTLVIDNLELQTFDFSEDLHAPLLEDEKGVSLERLSLQLGVDASNNWASAATSTGFATPGYPNSQRINPPKETANLFSLENKTFSPDGDAFEDLLVLNYQTDQAGYLASIRIFDASGRPIKTLARSEALASEGILTWDGSNEEGTKARIGVYVIWIEAFTPEGDKTVEKLSCVLAGRF